MMLACPQCGEPVRLVRKLYVLGVDGLGWVWACPSCERLIKDRKKAPRDASRGADQ